MSKDQWIADHDADKQDYMDGEIDGWQYMMRRREADQTVEDIRKDLAELSKERDSQ